MVYNLADLVEHAVDVAPERFALVDERRELTYAQFDERANKLAHALSDRGVGPGDHVGIYARNTVECVEAMLAVFKIRAVMVNINYRYVDSELAYIFDNSDIVALVHERRYSDKVTRVVAENDTIHTLVVIEDDTDLDPPPGALRYDDVLESYSGERDFGERSPDDLYLLYTGGTTGMPKGVMWRQEDVWRVLGNGIDFVTGAYVTDEWQLARAGAEAAQLVRLPAPPMIHGGAQWATFQSLFTTGKAVMAPDFSGDELWRLVEKHGVNMLFITGDAMARPMIDSLLAHPRDISSLWVMASSAALLSASTKERLLELLPSLVLSDAIGSSETGFSGMGLVKAGQNHDAGPRVKIDASTVVLTEDGTPVTPGSGRVGLLARRGHLPIGYYNDPVKTAATFREFDGVRYAIPGDYARVEDDLTVTMLGRGSVSINSGGEKIYPEEVEGALKSHPDVYDVLVVGVPDDRWGQRVAAVVQLRAGADRPTVEQLGVAARAHVAGYKVPRSVWFVDEIQRSPAGKPDYRWAKDVTLDREPDQLSTAT